MEADFAASVTRNISNPSAACLHAKDNQKSLAPGQEENPSDDTNCVSADNFLIKNVQNSQ